MFSVNNSQNPSNYETITLEVSNDHGNEIDQDSPSKQWIKLYIISTFLVNICIAVVLSVLNILCMNRLLQYGNEVLTNLQGRNVLYLDAISSIMLLILSGIFVISKPLYDYFVGSGVSFISVTATLIAVNLIYVASYHIPYMLLAFIYNSVQTSVI